MSDLYDDDVLTWSEQQAALLRRLAAGERVNDLVDWQNVAEEIESVGRSELRAVESHVLQALLHDLKAEAWPLSREVPHWRAEARRHRDDARAAYSPSMRQRIDLTQLYRRALNAMPDGIDGTAPRPVAPTSPFDSIDTLLAAP